MMNRKTFIKHSLGGLALASVTPIYAMSPDLQEPEPLDIKLVKEFVIAGHKNLPLVKEMLAAHPNLIYARYDWGNSDFEEAIEGAGHIGNKEIANYLISQGARVNLFVLTMLGKTDLVKPTLDAYPELVFAKGPHGFTLLHHAKVGEAKELYDYLIAKGLKETHIKIK
ncbi:ankyrin repeat domain-containing protein [Flavivirga algicola]|uniref:Ankyrin repeat domain-containing protein n=1 Tax=Flavivirga algicola TaxID=2729136 RepID=A0ABX1S1A6_9FLAO|nr:ankyrin repeat domain-containing protein [Flavivirga algicola]NMH88813.1 ankyrin repeat domain-containing protein [Flavivirga algicola]